MPVNAATPRHQSRDQAFRPVAGLACIVLASALAACRPEYNPYGETPVFTDPPEAVCDGLDSDGDGHVDDGCTDSDGDGVYDEKDTSCSILLPPPMAHNESPKCGAPPEPASDPWNVVLDWLYEGNACSYDTVVADVDRDGVGDIVCKTVDPNANDIKVTAISGSTGDILWRAGSVYGWAPIVAGDVDRDGVLELYSRHQTMSSHDLVVVDGATGESRTVPYYGPDSVLNPYPAVFGAELVDLHHDGKAELLSEDGVFDPLSGAVEFGWPDNGDLSGGIGLLAIADLYRDGSVEILCRGDLLSSAGVPLLRWPFHDEMPQGNNLFVYLLYQADTDDDPEILGAKANFLSAPTNEYGCIPEPDARGLVERHFSEGARRRLAAGMPPVADPGISRWGRARVDIGGVLVNHPPIRGAPCFPASFPPRRPLCPAPFNDSPTSFASARRTRILSMTSSRSNSIFATC